MLVLNILIVSLISSLAFAYVINFKDIKEVNGIRDEMINLEVINVPDGN
jgi:hypothetical protein